MKFKCPACSKIIIRNMDIKANKMRLTKRGYKSFCEKTGRKTVCKRVE